MRYTVRNMDVWQILILGITEGVTEFLPISSTAHLILVSRVLGIYQTEFVKTFEITIQLGAILGVVWLYWRDLVFNREIAKRVVMAFLPAAIFGFIFYKVFKSYLMENILVIISALVLGGVVLLWFESRREKNIGLGIKKIEDISYRDCLLIGVFQILAMVPGVSRAAATIVGGLLLGINKQVIVEFSFLLAVPTMLAAASYDLLKSGQKMSLDQLWQLGLGFFVSFVVAVLAVKFLLRYIERNDFRLFGVYRILFGLIFLFWWLRSGFAV